MNKVDKIADVFRSTGQPEITYVKRDSGLHERRLRSYLDEAGQLCLITGPSKTGKTTLYKKVLSDRNEIPLVVQCTKSKSASDIWREALEKVNFERVSESGRTSTKKVGVEAGVEAEANWAWLAKIVGKAAITAEADRSEEQIRTRVLAEPHPDLLIPILKHTTYVLVVEDFHYLDDDEKVLLFQQWKRFIDNEITIIILGTSHRAVDIAASNKDLVGRIGQIDISQWSHEDLRAICVQGFDYLKISVSSSLIDLIVKESVGLPIITQQACLEIVTGQHVNTVLEARRRRFTLVESDVHEALYNVATNRYSQFKTYYNTLVRGPREKARIYKTYELILACFTVDPISFNLTRTEIDRRLDKLCRTAGESKPPAASLNSTLGALHKFQETRKFQLLEWRQNESTLYIIEPSFLFYVRWRTKKQDANQLDFFEMLLKGIDIKDFLGDGSVTFEKAVTASRQRGKHRDDGIS